MDVERVTTSDTGQRSLSVLPKSVVNGIFPSQVFFSFSSNFLDRDSFLQKEGFIDKEVVAAN